MTLTELKAECKSRGLPVSGKKSDLVSRLENESENKEEDDDDDDIPVEKETKKKAPAKKKAEAVPEATKKIKTEESSSSKGAKKAGKVKVDEVWMNNPSIKGAPALTARKNSTIYNDGSVNWKVMLNQTDVVNNNNKYYVIELVEFGSGQYAAWTRWGRVGDTRASSTGVLGMGSSLDRAKQEFCKKFKDKSGNDWNSVKNSFDKFVKKNKKYDWIEMADDDDDDEPVVAQTTTGKEVKVLPCTLDEPTQRLCKLIFDVDMFKEQMSSIGLDVQKMPLGKLSKDQLKKGFDVLDELKKAVDAGNSTKINDYTSRFFTVIPHNFGHSRPPVLNTPEAVQQKFDLLETLGDILLAKGLLDEKIETNKDTVPHPLDDQFNKLKNKLEYVPHNSDEFKMIQKFTEMTKGRNVQIIDVWRTDREGELTRSKQFKDVGNRKLLWHGTSPAVVVAILKTGLRIMPHSGGRVGRGIYFASENAKSAGYVGTTRHQTEGNKNVGFMFLNEVALGKQAKIQRDDSSLRAAPTGFDSVWAQGSVEPDPKDDIEIEGSWGHKITVPQGKAINTGIKSSFFNSEYLIYNEGQTYMRYMLKCHFP